MHKKKLENLQRYRAMKVPGTPMENKNTILVKREPPSAVLSPYVQVVVIKNWAGAEITVQCSDDLPVFSVFGKAEEAFKIIDNLMNGTRMELSPPMKARIEKYLREARGIDEQS